MLPQQPPVRRSRLDDHLEPGAHCCENLVVGAAVRRPGVPTAAAKLETPAVDPEEDGRAFTLHPAQPDVKLTPYPASRPMAHRDERPPTFGPGPFDGLRNRPAHALAAKSSPCSEYSQRLWLSRRS